MKTNILKLINGEYLPVTVETPDEEIKDTRSYSEKVVSLIREKNIRSTKSLLYSVNATVNRKNSASITHIVKRVSKKQNKYSFKVRLKAAKRLTIFAPDIKIYFIVT